LVPKSLFLNLIPLRRVLGPAIAACLIGLALAAPPAHALLRIDGEQPFFVHPGKDIRDFCIVQQDSLYHIFYIQYDSGGGDNVCEALGHARSPDLIHWEILPAALSAGPDAWDGMDVWAPDVVWDPVAGQWTMLYTGTDNLRVQRTGVAFSTDLDVWTKAPSNPAFEPDTTAYFWHPDMAWSPFRDPFLYEQDGVWNMLNSARVRISADYGVAIVHRATSIDLVNWTDAGILFENDSGYKPWHELESVQYMVLDGRHHLFFTEYDLGGISYIAADSTAAWTMDNRRFLEMSLAPEVDEFDPGRYVFSRYTPMTYNTNFVVRIDSLRFHGDDLPEIVFTPPLDRNWALYEGAMATHQPTFGENPAARGEDLIGVVGNGYIGTAEAYRGPLGGSGPPGSALGDTATGRMDGKPFVLVGDFIDLLVGGGDYPQTCWVGLVDAAGDSVLIRQSGDGDETLKPYRWNVRAWQGRTVFIRILDQEQGPQGHLNVDEIVEVVDPVTDVPTAARALRLRGSWPNPANPATAVGFSLDRPGRVRLEVWDARGRRVWRSPDRSLPEGDHAITWRGDDEAGRAVASGVYVFRLLLDDRSAGGGKLSLVR